MANGRCDQENVIEQLKNGVNAMRMPGKGFGKQLGIHGNSGAGVESEGMVWVVDAECGKGDTGSENGVQTVSEHLDIIAMSDTQERQKDRVSFAWIQ